jgi:DNA-binding transcriptional MerR regulator
MRYRTVELITTAVAAVLAGLDPDTIRYHANEGNILAIRVARGNGEYQRLFVREDIERFTRKRQQQRRLKRGRKPELVGAADDAREG